MTAAEATMKVRQKAPMMSVHHLQGGFKGGMHWCSCEAQCSSSERPPPAWQAQLLFVGKRSWPP